MLPLNWILPVKKAFSALNFPLTKSKKSSKLIFNVRLGDGLTPSVTVSFWSFTVTAQLPPSGPDTLI